MVKKFLYCCIVAAISATIISCDKNDDASSPSGGEQEETVKNLSADGLANCYIVRSAGSYMFKADNRFNLGEGLPVPPEINPVEAGLVWQTVNGSISSVSLEMKDGAPYVNFEVVKAEGNALLAVFDKDGNIDWSWHIWMPKEDLKSVKTPSGYEVMTLNLGALSSTPGEVDSYGMLYQWGRKDPLPAAPTLTGDVSTVGAPLYDIEGNEVKIQNSSWSSLEQNTLAYAIANPTVCLSNYAQFTSTRDWLTPAESDGALWGNPNGAEKNDALVIKQPARKTCYDPSPAGWRVAPPDAFLHFTTTGGYSWEFADFNVFDANHDGEIDMDDYNYGWQFMVNPSTPLYFPAAARYDGSYAMLMGSMSGLWGNYWSNAPYPSIKGGAFCSLAFQTQSQSGSEMITLSPSAGGSRADAYSIRCIRDKK